MIEGNGAMGIRTFTVYGAAFAACLSMSQATAQSNGTQPKLEEVRVTATKMGEVGIQQVPGAVSVFTEDALRALNVARIQDLGFSMPGVTLGDAGTTRGVQNFSIRGLGISSSIPSVDPTVGVFIDGIYQGTTFGFVSDLFDVRSVEVLRGPQGVVFGRNVTGGAIVVNSARPSQETDLNIRARATGQGERLVGAAVGGALVKDKLAGRAVVYLKDDDGWFENSVTGEDFGDNELRTYRLSGVWSPADTFELFATFENGSQDGDSGTATQDIDAFSGHDLNFANPGTSETDWKALTLEATQELGADGTLTYLFGWRDTQHDGRNIDLVGQSTPFFLAGLTTDAEQQSHELRYLGSVGSSIDYVAGVYYFTQDLEYVERRDILDRTLLIGLGGTQDQYTAGLFANANWSVTEDITVNAGIRFTREEKEVEIASSPNPAAGTVGCDHDTGSCTYDFFDKKSWNNWSPKIGVEWSPQENLNFYSYWARGFRSGGYNFRSVNPLAFPPGPFDEEIQDTFEIGFKGSLADGLLTLNSAIFRNSIDQVQREGLLSSPVFGTVQGILNAGDVTIDGIEIEAQLRVGAKFMVLASVGLLDGGYDSVTADLNADGEVNSADSDLKISRLPETTYALSIQYSSPLSSGGSLDGNLAYAYRDEVVYNDSNTIVLVDADIVNANLTYTMPNNNLSIGIFGSNLLDERLENNGATIFGNRLRNLSVGRVWGLEVNYRL